MQVQCPGYYRDGVTSRLPSYHYLEQHLTHRLIARTRWWFPQKMADSLCYLICELSYRALHLQVCKPDLRNIYLFIISVLVCEYPISDYDSTPLVSMGAQRKTEGEKKKVKLHL